MASFKKDGKKKKKNTKQKQKENSLIPQKQRIFNSSK
jgi:hypothetical protein